MPLTSLTLTVTGPNGQSAFMTELCAEQPRSATSRLRGTDQATRRTITFTDCAAKPTASGSTSGLASGHPSVKLQGRSRQGRPNIQSVSIGLPSGLKFSRSAILTQKTCTTKQGKKKCTTTTLTKGLGIKGGSGEDRGAERRQARDHAEEGLGQRERQASGPLVTETKCASDERQEAQDEDAQGVAQGHRRQARTATSAPLSLKAH